MKPAATRDLAVYSVDCPDLSGRHELDRGAERIPEREAEKRSAGALLDVGEIGAFHGWSICEPRTRRGWDAAGRRPQVDSRQSDNIVLPRQIER